MPSRRAPVHPLRAPFLLPLVALLLLLAVPAWADDPVGDDPLADAAALLEAGRAGEAWELLAPLAAEGGAGADVLALAGRAALESNREAAAEELLGRSLELAPAGPARRTLIRLRSVQERHAEVLELAGPWLEEHPGDVPARIAAIGAAEALDDPERALALAAGLPDDDPRTRLLRARLLMPDRPREAAGELEPLLRDDVAALLAAREPAFAAAVWRQAAAVRTALGRHGEAAAAWERVTALLPGDREAWEALAAARVETGDVDAARQAMERAFALGEEARQEAGAEYERQQEARREAERRRMEEMMQRSGELVREAVRRRGEGDREGALETFRRALEVAPGDPRPRLYGVRLLIEMERTEEALRWADELVALGPDQPEARFLRALAHLAAGDPAAAAADLEVTLAAEPGHRGALNALATVQIARGDLDAARATLERVLELYPDDAVARQQLDRLNAAP